MDAPFTLSKIRSPMFTIACDALLKMGVSHHGWLRRKRRIHNFADKMKIGSFVTSFIRWEKCYVVLHNGCLYVYGNMSQKKPDKAMSLFGYTQILRAGEVRLKDVAWPFKLVYVLESDAKVHYFGAACEDELKDWMSFLRKEMILANNINFSEDSICGDTYSDLETPVSTRNYFRSIRNLADIRRQLGTDPDLENDDDYVAMPEYGSSDAVTNAECGSCDMVTTDESDELDYVLNPVSGMADVDSNNDMDTASSNSVSAENHSRYSAEVLRSQYSLESRPTPSPRRQVPLPPTVPPSDAEAPPVAHNGRPPIKPKPPTHLDVASRMPRPHVPSGKLENGVAAKPAVDDSRAASRHSTSSEHTEASGGISPTCPVSPPPPPTSNKKVPCPAKRTIPPATSLNSPRSLPSSHDVNDRRPLPPVPPVEEEKSVPNARMGNSSRTQQVTTNDLEHEATWSGDPGEGNILMMGIEEEGCYMIRVSSDHSAKTLLVVAEFQLRKYKINVNQDMKCSLQSNFLHKFGSVNELLSFYQANKLPNRSTHLTHPYTMFIHPND